MVISLKVKTLDSQTYEFSVDDEISVRQFKDTIAEKTNISADLQRIIYCGRVLADEKQLKEYDVNGKVVHVVERAPPNLRSGNNSGSSRNRREADGADPNLRASPLFRALDGMVIGAMTVPVNANIPQPMVNPSSSFCMNRITVARHMLDCANNIAAFLENPERGLNNPPMDILTRGRFTMESTVVEVGISADARVDIPQNQTQHFVEALNSAVSAALRQNGHPNFTVVQLPTVFRMNGSEQNQANGTGSGTEGGTPSESRSSGEEDASGGGATNMEPPPAPADPPTTEARSEPNAQARPQAGSPGSANGQTTCTRVLAEVINQMRTVQMRLEPFFQQYYGILLSDPPFEENDTAGRESAQRVFDRVSEALHYMSHAQHAISDLMLDLSQSTPRHLCCRPILVEQSGYVSSNNYLASFFEPNGNNNETPMTNNNAASTGNIPAQFAMPTVQSHTAPLVTATTTASTAEASTQPATMTPPPAAPTNGQGQSQTQAPPQQPQQPQQPPLPVNPIDLRRILGQLLQPMQMRPAAPRPTAPVGATTTAPAAAPANSDSATAANPQMQVARLIQAVVNSAPIHADVHVQINAPNLIQYGMPAQTSQTPSQTSQANGTAANNGATEPVQNTSENQPRVTTATHPTTSTQTRSTARPQVHISNLPPSQMWNARVIPANMVSSFDRFLPCSSHHIRDSEPNETPPQLVPGFHRNIMRPVRPSRRHSASENQLRSRLIPFIPMEHASATPGRSEAELSSLSAEDYNTPVQLFGSNLTLRDLINIIPNPVILNRIRNDLHAFIVNNLFSGAPITNENMNDAIDQVIHLMNSVLVFLPQFDLPDYDARASVENFLRNTLPYIFTLVQEDDSNEFGTRLVRELMSFFRRIFVILVTCIGRSNAELYLHQVAQMTIISNNPIEQDALHALHRYIMSAIIRELDTTGHNMADVQEFLVIRRPPPESNSTVTPMETDELPVVQPQRPQTLERVSPLQQGVTATSTTPVSTTLPIPAPVPESNESLPTVLPGSEVWHSNFPSHWLPIITRDIERQRKQVAQGPFSDAYISGMSAKRRKLVTNSKPPGEPTALLADGVRRALQSVGASSSNSATADDVAAAIASDPAAQLSYQEALRSNVQERLKTDPDFSGDKFPNSSKYFSK